MKWKERIQEWNKQNEWNNKERKHRKKERKKERKIEWMNLWNNANDLRHGQQPTGARMTQLLTKNDKTKYGHLPLEALEVWLPNMSFRPQVTMLYRLASSILTAESWENESRGSCKGFNRLAPTRVSCHHPSWSTSQWKSSHRCNHTLLESKESQYRSIWHLILAQVLFE